jgi:hypothetical protein
MFLVQTSEFSFADHEVSFRTPAKRYGSAYSIKLVLMRNGFTYDVPVWVKPDQRESSLDFYQLAELGWNDPRLKPELMSMSDESLEIPKFKNGKSDWANLPVFSRSCCYGVIGQDVLRDFEVRFDPTPPAHLEWTRVVPEEDSQAERKKFRPELSGLFSVHSIYGTVQGKKIDFSHTPYRLSLMKSELVMEPEWRDPNSDEHPLSSPIFQYQLVMPKRNLVPTQISVRYFKSARKVGFKPGLKVVRLNSTLVSTLDRFELEDFLKGRKSKTLTIATEKMSYVFDFEKNEFTGSQSLQTPPRRY